MDCLDVGYCLPDLPCESYEVVDELLNRMRLKSPKKVMPAQRFFLAIVLGVFASFECFVLGRVWATPLLLSYNALFLASVKSFHPSYLEIEKSAVRPMLVVGTLTTLGLFMIVFFSPIMRSAGLTYDALERMNKSLSLSRDSNQRFQSFEVIASELEEALELYPANETALLGLSIIRLQKYNVEPSRYIEIGKEAAEYAHLAIELSSDNWRGWSYLGLAESMQGIPERRRLSGGAGAGTK